jgi:hypothetical protein
MAWGLPGSLDLLHRQDEIPGVFMGAECRDLASWPGLGWVAYLPGSHRPSSVPPILTCQ